MITVEIETEIIFIITTKISCHCPNDVAKVELSIEDK